jgi:hypothetical protein
MCDKINLASKKLRGNREFGEGVHVQRCIPIGS